MGGCVSGAAAGAVNPEELSPTDREKFKRQEKLDKALHAGAAQKNKAEQQVAKLLLLGAGESGKSTLFRQMVKLFGKGFSDEARHGFKAAIHQMIIEALKYLIPDNAALASHDPKYKLSNEAQAVLEPLNKLNKDDRITPEIALLIKVLWADPAFRATFTDRKTVAVSETASYFFENVERISTESYLPTDEDLILMRIRTTGLVKEEFQIESLKFVLHDVGGQRSERRKWLNLFDGVTAVLFVAAVSEYDQVCFEDEKTNRIVESLNVFEETFNKELFVSTPIILFLNKRDLYEKKFSKVPIKDSFPDFNGATLDEGYEFFKNKFVAVLRSKRDVFSHVTNATDSDNCLKVFHAVQHIIVKFQLGESGFL